MCNFGVCGLFLAGGAGPYVTIFLLIVANFGDGMSGSGLFTKSLDITKRYAALSHGFMNSCGNISYYALSGSLIGWYLKQVCAAYM